MTGVPSKSSVLMVMLVGGALCLPLSWIGCRSWHTGSHWWAMRRCNNLKSPPTYFLVLTLPECQAPGTPGLLTALSAGHHGGGGVVLCSGGGVKCTRNATGKGSCNSNPSCYISAGNGFSSQETAVLQFLPLLQTEVVQPTNSFPM